MNALVQRSVSLIPWRLRNAIKKIPLVAPLQRQFVARFLEGREFIHVVDAANPRVTQQIASVNKILHDLEYDRIPQIVVLNKSDLLSGDAVETLERQISLDTRLPSVAISAIQRESLRPLVATVTDLILVRGSSFVAKAPATNHEHQTKP